MDNDELTRRYQAGEPLDQLAHDANMTSAGLQGRLRRIGVPTRTHIDKGRHLDEATIQAALHTHGSVNAAAKALGVGRTTLTARAQHFEILPRPEIPADLAGRYHAGAALADLAAHYDTTTTAVLRWLDILGVPRRPRGRQPRDG